MTTRFASARDSVPAIESPLASGHRLSIDDILHARRRQPIATTRGRDWGGVTVDLHAPYSGCAERYPGLDHHLVSFHPSGSAKLVQSRAGDVHAGVISAGTSFIMPAGYDSSWEGDTGMSARMRVPESLVATAAQELGRCETPVEIRNVFQVRDPVIERLAKMFLAEMELQPHPAQALIVDAISAALAAHLLRSYNAFELVEAAPQKTLTRLELQRLSAYVEDHIGRKIGLGELAALVGVSRFHFSRLFKRSTGSTAIHFVEECRIRRAQSLILESDLPLAEVALATGFADQSHFTRRFHRHVGCTPAAFARLRSRRRPARR